MFESIRMKTIVVLSAGVMSGIGCADEIPTTPRDRANLNDALHSSTPLAEVRIGEEVFARLAERIEDYGGHYFDDQGNMHVFLTGGSLEERERSELAAALEKRHTRAQNNVLMRSRLLAAPEIRVERAEFTWTELVSLRSLLNELVLGVKGVAFTDVAESRNRLVVAVTDNAAAERVAVVLRGSAIPTGAITTKLVAAPMLAEACSNPVTINQWCRGVRGGLQIRNQSGGRCTVGFNAKDDQGRIGFVTVRTVPATKEMFNSHSFFNQK